MATMELIDRETEFLEDAKVYQLSPRVRQSIETALQQAKDGQTIPGETVFREIDEWLGTCN
jgi:hypothetical protein